MTVTDRTVEVMDRLNAHCLYIGILPAAKIKEQWATADLYDPSNLHRPYGWVPPFHEPEIAHPEICPCAACAAGANVATFVLRFCPEIIAEQSVEVGLDDEHFTLYLDVIEYLISMFVLHRDKPWDEREALVDKALWDEAEDSLKLLTSVQMAVLDRSSDEPF